MKQAFGKDLDDDLWIAYVWDAVYYMMKEWQDGLQRKINHNVENMKDYDCSNVYVGLLV